MVVNKTLVLLLFITLVTSLAFANEDTLRLRPSLPKKISIFKSGKLVPLPVLYYTPETNIAGGLTVFSIFKTNPKDSSLNTSVVRFSANYTMNKQYWIEVLHTIIFPRNNYILTGNISYMKYPNYFFGIGGRTLITDREQFSYFSSNFYLRLIRKVRGSAYLGAQYHYNSMHNVLVQSGGSLSQGSIIGTTDGHSSGVGGVFIYDTRNSIVNAQKGFYIEISNLFNNHLFSSTYDFDLHRFEVRKYTALDRKKNKIIALQGLLMSSSRRVPFNRMPMLGGESLMRGYFFGRFRDRSMYVFQSEYRQTLSRYLGFTVFGSFGDVAGNIALLDLKNTKYSYGAGLRIAINSKERLNLRIDYGRGIDGGLFYFTVGEAF